MANSSPKTCPQIENIFNFKKLLLYSLYLCTFTRNTKAKESKIKHLLFLQMDKAVSYTSIDSISSDPRLYSTKLIKYFMYKYDTKRVLNVHYILHSLFPMTYLIQTSSMYLYLSMYFHAFCSLKCLMNAILNEIHEIEPSPKQFLYFPLNNCFNYMM